MITLSSGSRAKASVPPQAYWEVANLVPPRHMRLAVFSYTILKWQMIVPQFVAEIQLLDNEVCRCEFAKELGVVRS